MKTRPVTSFCLAAAVRASVPASTPPPSLDLMKTNLLTALPSITGQRGVVTDTDTNAPISPRFYRVTVP